jgi:hypothetical protein
MSTHEESTSRSARAWWRSPTVLLIALGILGAVVITRLSLMTYWSLTAESAVTSNGRLVLFWVLSMAVLAMLTRFAWQVRTGRHRTR